MFERFTDRARRSLVLAQDEARGLQHNFIGTEHLLLGLLAEGTGVAAVVLTDLGLTLERAREVVGDTIGPSADAVVDKPPFTPRAKRCLELSLQEALKLGHNYIGTEHLLLGVIREGQGVGAQVLVSEGYPLIEVSQAVFAALSGFGAAQGGPPAGGPPGLPEPARLLRPGGAAPAARIAAVAARLAREGSVGRSARLSTHHYLLALFEDANSMAARALAELGVTRARVEEVIARLDIGQTSDAPPRPAPAAPVEFDLGHGITMRIGDRDLAQQLLTRSGGFEPLARRLRELAVDLAGESEPAPPDPTDPPEPPESPESPAQP